MKTFYVIKLSNPQSGEGFVIITDKGIKVSSKPTTDIAQFPSSKHADRYIFNNNLTRNGTRAEVISNHDLVTNGYAESVAGKPIYCIINTERKKMFYDTVRKGYYFDEREAGYCGWTDEESVKEFIRLHNLPAGVTFLKVK